MKNHAYFSEHDCDLTAFIDLIDRRLDIAEAPSAAEIVKNVPVYNVEGLSSQLSDPGARRLLLAEWALVLGRTSGVLVLRGAYTDVAPIDAATRTYEAIIEEERGQFGGGDHFATAGANDRIWNSLQKLCVRDPATFAHYFGNVAIAAVCEAWLGPGYQVTSQVNLVRPGGAAQTAHRDYHLGFQTRDTAAQFPVHAHDLSAVLTLQGAVAHCDMTIESGPTKLLPFSQLFRPGYLAYRRSDFAELFEERCVQLPLTKGDVLFFNPALFHAAGDNRSSNIHRMANLLQVSSPFGRAMEAVDRVAMCKMIYPALLELRASGRIYDAEIAAAIASCAEGYSFPTNLDSDPPVGGLAPVTQAALMHQALSDGVHPVQFNAELDAHTRRRFA